MAHQLATGTLFVIGNPLLDISAPVPKSFLDKYGLKEANACLAEAKHLPLFDELVKNFHVEYVAGGAAQNSARATSWMLQKSHIVRYVGSVGKDQNAKILKDNAESYGVETHYYETSEAPTGTCAVLVVDKERSLVANLGAANHYKKAHLDSAEIQKYIQEAKFFYSTGFFLTVSTESAVAIGEHAAHHDKPFAWNISAPFVAEFFFDNCMSVIKYVDIVISNESEAIAFSKKSGWNTEDLHAIAEKIAHLPKVNTKRPRMTIITHGAKPTVVFHNGKVEEFQPILLPKEKIVDTNGAGDSFVGGFLSRYIQHRPLEQCVAAGHYCALEVIQRSGVTYPAKPSFPLD